MRMNEDAEAKEEVKKQTSEKQHRIMSFIVAISPGQASHVSQATLMYYSSYIH